MTTMVGQRDVSGDGRVPCRSLLASSVVQSGSESGRRDVKGREEGPTSRLAPVLVTDRIVGVGGASLSRV